MDWALKMVIVRKRSPRLICDLSRFDAVVREEEEIGQEIQEGEEGEIQKVQKGRVQKGKEGENGGAWQKVS